ncbi:MAG: hypothetical protein IJ740_13445 [Ruminococcus sp.]|nr:hypothetical protein [Ruminococcus sp.]
MADVEIVDNSGQFVSELENDIIPVMLEELGLRAEGYAAVLTPVGTPESTGIEGYVSSGLRQSITHTVDTKENAVIIGSNKPYAPFVELGTGIHNPQGRRTPWIWIDKNGKPHKTNGMKATHMLKKAVADHTDEWKRVIIRYLKGGN